MTRDYRSYGDLSRKEAEALLQRVTAIVPRDAAAFIEDVRRRGGPADALDSGRDSMLTLWAWFLESYSLPRPPATDAEMRASDPPWWYEFTGKLAGMELGPDLSKLVSGMAAYFAAALIRQRPESTWVLERSRNAIDRYEPLLHVPGTAAFPVYSVAIFTAWRSLEAEHTGDVRRRAPDRLQRLFDVRLPPDGQATAAAPPPKPGPPLTVEAIEDDDDPRVGSFTHEISFAGVVAHEEEDRVAAFVEALGREDGVAEALHEDRELVIVDAPGLDVAALEAIATRVWDASDRDS